MKTNERGQGEAALAFLMSVLIIMVIFIVVTLITLDTSLPVGTVSCTDGTAYHGEVYFRYNDVYRIETEAGQEIRVPKATCKYESDINSD